MPTPQRRSRRQGISLELDGPWGFYGDFWRANQIEHLANVLSVPEMALRPDVGCIQIPPVLRNNSDKTEEVAIAAALPPGWSDKSRYDTYPLKPGEFYQSGLF